MLKVWGRRNSLNVQKVMWVLEELEVPHNHEDAGGAFGKLDEPWYRAMNPHGLVPVIEDEGVHIWESNAIVRYLAAKHGQGHMMPLDLGQRAQAEMWMDWTHGTLMWPLFTVFVGLIRTPEESRDDRAIAKGVEDLAALFKRVDAWFEGSSYIVGDTFTIGDVPLGAVAYRYFSLPIERPRLSRLEQWYGQLTQRPAFAKHVMLPLT